MKNAIKTYLGKLVNYATCVVLLPFVIMIYQYQKNIQYLSLLQVLAFCCIVAIAFLALFFIARIIIKSDFGAFLFSCIIFFSIFLFRKLDFTLYFMQYSTRGQRALLYFGIALSLASFVAVICRLYKEKLQSKTIIIVTFVMLASILIQNITLIMMYDSKQKTNELFYKDNFNITQPLEVQPNIYWIHCDGMLGFESMSHFFGDDQEKFTSELESRGFWINREAAFEANHSTAWAIPTLMSPFYYDSVLAWKFDLEYARSNPQNEDLLNNPNLRLHANNASNRVSRIKNETIMAFKEAGYNTSTIAYIDQFFFPTVNQFYTSEYMLTPKNHTSTVSRWIDGDNGSELQYLYDLLMSISYIPTFVSEFINTDDRMKEAISADYIVTDIESSIDLFSEWETDDARRIYLEKYNMEANALYDTLKLSKPRFTLYAFMLPHNPFTFDEYGNYDAVDSKNPLRYPAHHTFSSQTLLKILDMILEHDPDAVIVLQADHGLHALPSVRLEGFNKTMDTFSYTRDEVTGLWDQVMSAVRLPEEQMTPETEQILSDPRNISRYLINTYVGENYEYIPNQYRQTITYLYNNSIQTGN